MAEATDIEKRLAIVERRLNDLSARVASALMLAGKATQDAKLGGGGGGGGGGGVQAKLAYSTSAIGARAGNTCGQGTYQVVKGVGHPPVLTATGDPNDSGQRGNNITGGAAPASAFGLLLTIDGNDYFVVLDCKSTVNPGTPAAPAAGG